MHEDLSPSETLVDGGPAEGRAAARVAWLAAERLERVGTDASGWETLYRDPHDGRLWELTYRDSGRHGGGPPRLAVLAPEAARAKYGSVAG